jgi:hypothetical protein
MSHVLGIFEVFGFLSLCLNMSSDLERFGAGFVRIFLSIPTFLLFSKGIPMIYSVCKVVLQLAVLGVLFFLLFFSVFCLLPTHVYIY